jgi:hypothetical protein
MKILCSMNNCLFTNFDRFVALGGPNFAMHTYFADRGDPCNYFPGLTH